MMVSILKVYKYEKRYFLDGFQLLEFDKMDLIKGNQEQLYELPFQTILEFVDEYQKLYNEQMDIEFKEISENDLEFVYRQNNKQH